MTLKDLTAAAGIERVIWIDDLFDPPAQGNAEVELRALATRANVRGLTITLADHVLTPDRSVDEWLVELTEARDEGVTEAFLLAHLQERLTEGGDAATADYNQPAIAEIIASFGEEVVTKTSASNWQEIKPVLADGRRTLVLVDREFYVAGVARPLGEDILQDLVKAKLPTVYAVLLTRSVGDNTEQLRAELAERLGIPFQDFVVAAKTASEEQGRTESHLCASFQVLFTHQVCIDLPSAWAGMCARWGTASRPSSRSRKDSGDTTARSRRTWPAGWRYGWITAASIYRTTSSTSSATGASTQLRLC